MEIFLKTEIQILWPEGWMSMHALLKLYNNFSESYKRPSEPINTNSAEMQKIAFNSTLSIIPVDKVLATESSSSSKIKKSLPIDISKASNSLTITPTTSTSVVGNMQKHEERKTTEPKKSIINEVIVVDDKPKKSVIESISTNNSDISKKYENKHCQIIDLTENSESRRKPGQKSKTKYHDNDDNKSSKQSDHIKNDSKDITASSAYNNIIQESLSELNRYPQNLKSTSNSTHSSNKLTDHSIKKLSTPSNYANSVDHLKYKTNSEGDDIQRVMEGLKALQNMASPAKTETSSPVSVISFNKNHSKQNNYTSATPSCSKTDFNSGFQEAFQRQVLNDSSLLKSSPAAFKNRYFFLLKLIFVH